MHLLSSDHILFVRLCTYYLSLKTPFIFFMCFSKLKCEPDVSFSSFQFDPLTIESKKVATVVLMLNSPEEEILAKACEAIYKFALKGLNFF